MGFEQLKNIIEQSRKEAEEQAKKPITACPQCAYIPLKVISKGEKLCPICGWTSAW